LWYPPLTGVVRITESKVHLKSHHGKFLCAEPSGKVVADRSDCKEWETWTMRTTNGRATFQSAHGKYLCAEVKLPPPPNLNLTSLLYLLIAVYFYFLFIYLY
jgi:hypothetical protein